jgi:predicted secreted Zn-dependent protease
MIRTLLALALTLLALPAQAEIRTQTVEKTYPIAGTTGRALYASIGERGPRIRKGASSAVAKTDFDLKWGRDYVRDGDACVLAAARPFLTVTYTLPEPVQKLPPETAARWKTFIAAIRAHEAVHGKVYRGDGAGNLRHDRRLQAGERSRLQARSATRSRPRSRQAYARYKATRTPPSRKAEMANGGPIHRLILELIR